ncbi:MAG: hypothetical protein WBB82_02370 [Limnothrix sp.]
MSNITDTLIQAGLLNEVQVQVALHDQKINPQMRISEILALRGWISEETVDFFELLWEMRKKQTKKENIGQYFLEARLITAAQIDDVLAEQRVNPLRFGEIAILKGYLKQETVNFFVKHLFPEKSQIRKISSLSRVENSTHSQKARRTMTSNDTLQQMDESADQEDTNRRRQRSPQKSRRSPAVPSRNQQQRRPPALPKEKGLLGRIKRQVQDKISAVNPASEPPVRPRKNDPEIQDARSTDFDLAETEDINFDDF